jgi:hypothetical protein
MHGMVELSHCLTDGDPEALRRDRKLRGFGFGASVALETALVAALVILTLANPAMLPKILAVTAVPFQPPPTPPAIQPLRTSRLPRTFPTSALRQPVIGRHVELSPITGFVPPGLQVGASEDILTNIGIAPGGDSSP